MNITDPFIRRPVLASVISLLILVVGLRSMFALDVRQYPATQDSIVSVTTYYPGAASDLVKGFVTTPLMQAIAEADGIDYLYASSTQGISTIEAHMKLNYDPNAALSEIQAKVASRGSDLPEDVLDNMVGEHGALAGMAAGATWIDTSTTDYHNTLQIAGLAGQRGLLSLEAPVSNLSHMGVDFANMSFFVAGDAQGYTRSKDALDTMGKVSFFVGRIGTAQTVKLLTNLLFYTATVVAGEVLCLAHEAGISTRDMWCFMLASHGNSVAVEQFLPFVFDGSYDRSCTLEIAVKDMGLTVDLADELGVAVPLGRVVNESYRTAGARYDGQDNHLEVIEVMEVANDLRLRIPDFIAPSKYGANPNYARPETYLEDHYGRIKPRLPASYDLRPPELRAEQLAVATTLTDFVATVNAAVLEEAYHLGERMGLDHDLLTELIRWSVGTSWVSDHEDTFVPDRAVVSRMKDIKTSLDLPATPRLLAACASANAKTH